VGKMRKSSQLLYANLFLALSLTTTTWQVVAASSDAYIDALNAEISGPPSASANSQEEKNIVTLPRKQNLASDLSSGLSHQAFEAELKNSFLGSYIFYRKLNNTDKEAVYKYYQEAHNIDDIREKIKSLLTR
jgi:hypothetical protein